MLKRSSSNHAAKLSERHRPMDCRVKPGNDERRSSRRACAREPSGWRSANLRTAVTAAARFALRRFHSLQEKRKLRRRSADRRRGVLSEPRERMLPLARASGPARAEAQRARLSAFRRGTCGGERTPPLNSSPRFLGPGVIGCYPHLASPFSPASCLAVPVVVPDGRIRRSRPGAR